MDPPAVSITTIEIVTTGASSSSPPSTTTSIQVLNANPFSQLGLGGGTTTTAATVFPIQQGKTDDESGIDIDDIVHDVGELVDGGGGGGALQVTMEGEGGVGAGCWIRLKEMKVLIEAVGMMALSGAGGTYQLNKKFTLSSVPSNNNKLVVAKPVYWGGLFISCALHLMLFFFLAYSTVYCNPGHPGGRVHSLARKLLWPSRAAFLLFVAYALFVQLALP